MSLNESSKGVVALKHLKKKVDKNWKIKTSYFNTYINLSPFPLEDVTFNLVSQGSSLLEFMVFRFTLITFIQFPSQLIRMVQDGLGSRLHLVPGFGK